MAENQIGRNIAFKIYNADGTEFEGLVMHKSTFETVVMSLADKITGDVYYKDNRLAVTMQEYIVYNGVKYILVNPPTIIREGMVSDNSELKGMTRYSFEFYHPMYQLFNIPFCDVAVSIDEKCYLSESKIFSWIGKPNDFIAKLNKNLEGTQWICVKSSNFPIDKDDVLSPVIPFDNAMISDALKSWYDTWEIPYVVDQVYEGEAGYSQGKHFKVVLGLPSNEVYDPSTQIPYLFRMGQGVGLKNDSRTPRNNKIVTRISGYGSEDNIPYGYPQIVWEGDPTWKYTINDDQLNPKSYPIYDGIVNGENVRLIKHPFTRTHLMPSIYVERLNKKVNPYASGYDPDIELIDYYDATGDEYVNKINPLAPSYEIHAFEDVKPELGDASILDAVPVTNSLEVDTDWKDTMDENGNYVQSYFRVTLPSLSFDLYACAAITQEMHINMRSGACLGCTFPIQVDWEDYKLNFYDSDGNFAPDGEQRDYDKYPDSSQSSISVILQKEYSTFGVLMPNRYQYPKSGDKFVILGISLPLSYIHNAEAKLDNEMRSYMLLNNVYYFDYPLKFDEYFLAKNTRILSQIRTNTIIRFLFAGVELHLYVKQISIKFGDGPLPKYDITLTDNIDVVVNPIGQVRENVDKLAVLLSMAQQSTKQDIEKGSSDKLSRIYDDEAHGIIGFLKGAWFGTRQWVIDALGNANLNNVTANGVLRALRAYINNVQSTNYSGDGMLDTGWRITNEYEGSKSKATFDYLYIRMKAIFEELELRKISHIGGNLALSPASGRAWKVEYFDGDGKQLGVDEFTVPYTLGGRLLALFSHNLANRFLSRKKKVSRELTSEEKLRTKRVRVLMFSDDGTTRTMQNWTVGAQARCQTFNITQQMDYHGSGVDSNNPDVEFWTGRKVQNTYWWRLVSAVGEATCEDNKVHSYVEFLVNQPNASTYEDVGSDLPAVGDEFCQFGHRTNPTQGNVIMIETANDDSPAMKFYHHVNSWNLNGKRCINISPELFEAKASIFKWITEYGTESQVINRGLWVDIDVDGDGKRRCYYNDIAAHNGVVWRCIIADGTHKEDANGHWYTQEELDRMTQEQIAALIDVRNYTTQEPSDTAGDWEKYVYASIAPFLKLSDAMVAVPCENDGKATSAVSKTITVKLMVTNLEATITSVTLEGSDSYVTKSGNNILVSIPANTVVTNKNYTVTAEGTCNGQKYVASDQISVYAVMKGDAAYEVTANPNHWIWWQEGANYSYEDIMRMIEEGTYPSDLPIKIDGRPADNSLGNSGTQISVTVDGVAQTFRIERVTASVNGVTTSYDNTLGRVWVTAVPTNVEGGYIDISVRYGNNALTTLRVQFSCNLLGTWRELTFGDVNAAIATKTFDILDENGNVVSHKTIAQYFRSSSQDSASLSHTVNTQGSSISNLNTRVSTAEGNITTISSEVNTIDGKFSSYYTKTETASLVNQSISTATEGMVTTSNFEQTAHSFSLCTEEYADDAEDAAKRAAQGYANTAESNANSHSDGNKTDVINRLKTTGIRIDGTNRYIDILADKVTFKDSDGNVANIRFNTKDNVYYIGSFLMAGDHLYGNVLDAQGNMTSRGIEMYNYGSLIIDNNDSSYVALRTKGAVNLQGRTATGGLVNAFNINDSGQVVMSPTKCEINAPTDINNDLTVDDDLKVNGKIIGDIALSGSLKTSSFTLPASPKDGQMFLCKGLGSDLYVTTKSHPITWADSRDNQTQANSSVNLGDDSVILVFSSTYNKWIRFDCW